VLVLVLVLMLAIFAFLSSLAARRLLGPCPECAAKAL
jgi:hypothetical protein